MSPHRPELMVFVSPDKKMELHSKIHEKSVLIKKSVLENEKIIWAHGMDVEYVFSDPTSSRLFTVGGLGDSGSSLGVVEFYNYDGTKKIIQIKDVLPNLEALSAANTLFSNFPWVSALNITESELLIWVCDKFLVKVNFRSLKSEVENSKIEPPWVAASKKQIVSNEAKKLQWKLKQ